MTTRGKKKLSGLAATGSLMNVSFPIVRRAWPGTISQQITSIQPMTAPVGSVFYFNYTYSLPVRTHVISPSKWDAVPGIAERLFDWPEGSMVTSGNGRGIMFDIVIDVNEVGVVLKIWWDDLESEVTHRIVKLDGNKVLCHDDIELTLEQRG